MTKETNVPGPGMGSRVALSLGAAIYGVVVPALELNATHVWDPTWPPHARLHEVWQLVTNSLFAAVALFMIWRRRETRAPAAIACVVTWGFFVAYAVRDAYGGSMVLSNGVEKTLFGANLGVVGFMLVNVLTAGALVADQRSRSVEGDEGRGEKAPEAR